MKSILREYLILERAMEELDTVSVDRADRVRDLMDEIWYDLSEEDKTLLGKLAEARNNVENAT